jgi:hypothetical protein
MLPVRITARDGLSRDEIRKLDRVFGRALLDREVATRLQQRDPVLLDEYGISDETRVWLQTLRYTSLTDLSKAIALTP